MSSLPALLVAIWIIQSAKAPVGGCATACTACELTNSSCSQVSPRNFWYCYGPSLVRQATGTQNEHHIDDLPDVTRKPTALSAKQ